MDGCENFPIMLITKSLKIKTERSLSSGFQPAEQHRSADQQLKTTEPDEQKRLQTEKESRPMFRENYSKEGKMQNAPAWGTQHTQPACQEVHVAPYRSTYF